MSDRLINLWSLVRQIPRGKVVSYGLLGSLLDEPTSGRIVGRWMTICPPDAPWWRVVAKSGNLPIQKLNPVAAMDQESRLVSEGVVVCNGVVDKAFFLEDL